MPDMRTCSYCGIRFRSYDDLKEHYRQYALCPRQASELVAIAATALGWQERAKEIIGEDGYFSLHGDRVDCINLVQAIRDAKLGG